MSMLTTKNLITRETDRQPELAVSKTRPRPIELQTENGFAIVRRGDVDETCLTSGTEHYFVVRDPHGYQLDIMVDFSPSVIAEVTERSFGRLTSNSTYWINCAERHLADYLWENDDYPPDGRITIEYLTPDDVDSVQRWETEAPQSAAPALSSVRATVSSPNGDGSKSGAKAQPIEFITENEYRIVRMNDLDNAVKDTPQACEFVVTNPGGVECQITVRFDEEVIKQIQTRRRTGQLTAASKYWPVIAEKHLADFLWRINDFPPSHELIIDELSGEDLLLGAHWQEND